jgi:hypothetical protein
LEPVSYCAEHDQDSGQQEGDQLHVLPNVQEEMHAVQVNRHVAVLFFIATFQPTDVPTE